MSTQVYFYLKYISQPIQLDCWRDDVLFGNSLQQKNMPYWLRLIDVAYLHKLPNACPKVHEFPGDANGL